MTAATTPMISAGVRPKSGKGSPGNDGARKAATVKPMKAPVIIMPSIPMFTMPDRSFMSPHRAPRAMGVARPRTMGATFGSTSRT